jgi:hypothetical protein
LKSSSTQISVIFKVAVVVVGIMTIAYSREQVSADCSNGEARTFFFRTHVSNNVKMCHFWCVCLQIAPLTFFEAFEKVIVIGHLVESQIGRLYMDSILVSYLPACFTLLHKKYSMSILISVFLYSCQLISFGSLCPGRQKASLIQINDFLA